MEETELMDTSPQTVSETDIFDADRAPVSLQISAKKAKPIQNNSTFMA